jgi:hypothetical protein
VSGYDGDMPGDSCKFSLQPIWRVSHAIPQASRHRSMAQTTQIPLLFAEALVGWATSET